MNGAKSTLGVGFSTADMGGPDPATKVAAALIRGMRELGHVYGRDFVTEPRGAEGKDRPS